MKDKEIKRVRLVVSATGYYIKWVVKFCETAHNLFGVESDSYIYKYYISIITDKSDKKYISIKKELERIVSDKNTYHIEEIDVRSCPPFPWPVMTLYKPFLCSLYVDEKDNIVWCGNVNIEFKPNITNWYDDNKVNVSWHHSHPAPYFNTRPYYIQGGFVCARADIMEGLCREWQSKINWFVNMKREIPEWHDETALNILFNENISSFNPSFILYTKTSDKMDGQFALLNLDGKQDNVFKRNWKHS